MTRYELGVIVAAVVVAATAIWLWPIYVLYALIAVVWIVAVLVVAWFFGMAMAGGWGL